MTSPPCGATHHDHPDTQCTQPARHYRRDRDPHGGPLIIDGRECGSAAWDEPQEQQMTDRIPLDDLTSNQLDALYDQLAAAQQRARELEDRITHLRDRWASCRERVGIAADKAVVAEAAIARVRAVHHRDGDSCTVCTIDFGRRHAPWPCPTAHALGEPAAHVGDGADAEDCPACNAADADAHGIRTCPADQTTEK